MPMRQAVHLLCTDHYTRTWGTRLTEPRARWDLNPDRWWHSTGARLTPLNHQNIYKLHFMIHHYSLHKFFEGKNSLRQVMRILRPKVFKITLRQHHDWGHYSGPHVYFVGLRSALMVCDGIVDAFQLELEQLQHCEAHVGEVLALVRPLQGNIKRARGSQTDKPIFRRLSVAKEPRTWEWTRAADAHGCRRDYEVTELEWVNVPVIGHTQERLERQRETNALGDSQCLASNASIAWQTLPLLLCRDRIHRDSINRAHAGESQRRKLFARQMIGNDLEEKRREWASKGSLMRFV